MSVDYFSNTPNLFCFQEPTSTNGRTNESIARIEALKVRILDSHLSDQEKKSLFTELDILRGVFLETIAHLQPDVSVTHEQGVVTCRGAGSMLLEGIIGRSKKILEILDVISKIAPSRLPVLFEGETGTGKELFARIVHLNSGRDKFVAVNCGAFPAGVIESELFGHVRGAFTNASTDRKGKFEEANGGSIFLDEIGEMDLTAQVKLLRVLEQGELQRVGSDQTHKIDVRVITATNKVLDRMVREGRFREDLLYRINLCPLTVPPLRERRDEIEILLEFFLQEWAAQNNNKPPKLSNELKTFLLYDYEFPGNIRELKNIAQYISCVAEADDVTIFDLPERYRSAFDQTRKQQETCAPGGVAAVRQHAEQHYMREMLVKHHGVIEGVCADTGLSKARVYQIMKVHGIRPGDFRRLRQEL